MRLSPVWESSMTLASSRSIAARPGPMAEETSASPATSARARAPSSGKRRKRRRRTRGAPAQCSSKAVSSTRPGRALARRKGPVPTGSSLPGPCRRRGLCMAKKGWESVERRAAFGRSRVIWTTWGPMRSARPGKARSRRRCSRLPTTASASSEAPSWNRTPFRRVRVQTRWSGLAQVVARTPSGRSEPGRTRTSVSHTLATIWAATMSVAWCGSRLAGSAKVPTTRASAGTAASHVASRSAITDAF